MKKSRLIKFRVWDKESKYMDNWDKLQSPLLTLDGQLVTTHKYITGTVPVSPDKYILMQFTGLLDRNGKEIYEGDIVRVQDHFQTVFVKEVLYEQDAFVIRGTEKDNVGMSVDSEWSQRLSGLRQIEVIGNIYENKELLK